MWYDHSFVLALCKKLKKKKHSFSHLMVGRISFCKSFNLFKVTTNYSKVTAIHFKQKWIVTLKDSSKEDGYRVAGISSLKSELVLLLVG